MQFFSGISRNTQSKSYMLSLLSVPKYCIVGYSLTCPLRHILLCLNIPQAAQSIWCQKPPHYRQNLVGVKKDGCSNKIKLAWENKTIVHCKEWWAANLFILCPGSFESSAQSAYGSAIHSYWGCQERVLRDFLHFGYCLVLKRVPNKLISSVELLWGLVLLYQ